MGSKYQNYLISLTIAAFSGSTWLLPNHLVGALLAPLASILLIVATSLAVSKKQRFATAFLYYLIGSVSIVGSINGFYGGHHLIQGFASWLAASLLLAAPWIFAKNDRGVLIVLIITVLPPLGLIGWLSPLTASGVLFPGIGWAGLGFTLVVMTLIPSLLKKPSVVSVSFLVAFIFISVFTNMIYQAPAQPNGWVSVNTAIKPSNGDIFAAIQNNQSVINSAIAQGHGARVVVLPEAVIDRWLTGTRRQLANAVPNGQTWLIGVQTAEHNSLAKIANNKSFVVADAAAVMLGGNWQPWSSKTLQPSWWQDVAVIDKKRVWASLCVEQVLPFTWIEALFQEPDIVLAISNQWWADSSSSAPQIQQNSANSWARLMGVPMLTAINH